MSEHLDLLIRQSTLRSVFVVPESIIVPGWVILQRGLGINDPRFGLALVAKVSALESQEIILVMENISTYLLDLPRESDDVTSVTLGMSMITSPAAFAALFSFCFSRAFLRLPLLLAPWPAIMMLNKMASSAVVRGVRRTA